MQNLDRDGKSIDELRKKKLWLFDLDGTVYIDKQLIPGVDVLFKLLNDQGRDYVFVTNNSSRSIDQYVRKVSGLGIAVGVDNFYTSVDTAIAYLKRNYVGERVYVQGTQSLLQTLREHIDVTTEYDIGVHIVLVGFDTELTSEKLKTTCHMLQHSDVFLATNADMRCPIDFGYVPDCGSICRMLTEATGKTAKFLGKPQAEIVEAVLERYGVEKKDAVLIGDRFYTDICAGINAGVDSIFVLSGEGTLDDIQQIEKGPTYVLDSVADLLPVFNGGGLGDSTKYDMHVANYIDTCMRGCV